MKNKKIIVLRIFIIVLICIWMKQVFNFSAQNANESSNLSLWVASLLTKDLSFQEFLEPYIRKVAHFTEYAIGGGLYLSLFATFKIKEEKQILFASIIGFLYAISDEFHQLFIEGRSGQIKDVFIDTLGVITGVLGMCAVIKIFKKIKEKNKKTE